MLLDLAMIATLLISFGVVIVFANWCEKQINR